jgi:glycosyltransferase involved in cell wall biosynthesis
MAKIGVPSSQYYFSTSEALEVEGLSRADYIFAIQENEGEYFRKRVKSEVIVQPPTLSQNFIKYEPQKDKEIIVGFIGSAHYPNILAIENFIKVIAGLKHNITIKIAGQICHEIFSGDYPNFVKLIGAPDDILLFYESCDLMINPDMLYSGLKVKSLEALSYGVPLVSTKMAMDGIETDYFYHQFDALNDLAHYVAKISKKELCSMAVESRSVFENFSKKYDFESQILEVVNHD